MQGTTAVYMNVSRIILFVLTRVMVQMRVLRIDVGGGLGEDLRAVLLSATEGEDKPLKYPTIFNTADVAIVTKIDLAEAVEFDRQLAYRNIQQVRPGMRVIEVSAKTGFGMDEWISTFAGL